MLRNVLLTVFCFALIFSFAQAQDNDKFGLPKSDAKLPEIKIEKGTWVLVNTMLQIPYFQTIKVNDDLSLEYTIREGKLEFSPIAKYSKKNVDKHYFWTSPTWPNFFINRNADYAEKAGEEEIAVGNKKLKCQIYQAKALDGTMVMNWFSDEAPFDGLVLAKVGKNIIFQLNDFGTGNELPGGNQKFVARQYSSDANHVVLNEAQFKNYFATTIELYMNQKNIGSYIVECNDNEVVKKEDMLKSLEDVRVAYVGEHHDSEFCHKMQLDVIKHMHSKKPETVIGFEMFYRTEEIQKGLDDFIFGDMSEQEFKAKVYDPCWSPKWYGLYRDIFLYAKEKKIKLVGLNCPKHLKGKFRDNPDQLSKEERSWFAKEVDYSNEQHKKITRFNFRAMASQGMNVDVMYPGQCIWDDTMGESVVNYLKDKPKAQMVVLVGCLHVAYRLTMPERAFKKAKKEGFELTSKVLFPHTARGFADSAANEFMRMDITDYVYFVPAQQMQRQGGGGGGGAGGGWLAAFQRLQAGDIDTAEKMVANENTEIGIKVKDRIKKIREAEKLSQGGKHDEARALINELPDRYTAIKNLWLSKIKKCEETGEWPGTSAAPAQRGGGQSRGGRGGSGGGPTSGPWMQAFGLMKVGKMKEAEELLKTDNTEFGKKVSNALQTFKKSEQLARDGKYDEARNVLGTVHEMYSPITKRYQQMINTAEQTGEWPEK